MSVLLEIGADEQLDKSVVATSCNQTFSTRPIDAVDGANVVILLLEDYVYILDAITMVVLIALYASTWVDCISLIVILRSI